jgi:serine/threonine protein kinase
MNAGADPARWPQPRMNNEEATAAWLDVLAAGICTPEAFLDAMREQFQGRKDREWEVLSLLDQYYRRGRIKAEVFHAIRSRLEGAALEGAALDGAALDGVKESAANVGAQPSNASTQPPNANTQPPNAATQPSNAGTQPASALIQPPNPVTHPSTAVTAPAVNPRVAPAAPSERKTSPVAQPPVREVAVGDLLRNRYRVRAVVGHGGMGTVFEASDEYRIDLPVGGRRLAVKVLHTAITQREELLSELKREFQHLQLLSHPNIVRVHEFDRDGDVAFFTMELLSGALLSRLLQARDSIALPRPEALAVIRDVGAAVYHAHSRGVIHGDINPQNIFITNDGELRVLDFGASHTLLADRLAPEPVLSQRVAVATPGYASCQLLQGQPPDARDDLFALACVAYLLLSGQHPFPNRTAVEARAQRLRVRRPARLSGQQWRALRDGLRWDRERRPANVQKWLERLELSDAAPRLPRLAVLADAPSAANRKPLRALAAVAIIVLLAVGAYWAATNGPLAPVIAQWRIQAAPSPSAPAQEAEAPGTNPAEPSIPTTRPPRTPPASPAPRTAAPPSAAAPASTVASTTKIAPAPVSRLPPPAPRLPPPAPRVPAPATVAPAHAANIGSMRIETAADTVDVFSGDTVAHVSVRRTGSFRGEVSFKWWTESGTAKPGLDFSPAMPHVASIGNGSGSVTLDIPVSGTRRGPPKSFYVVIDQDESGPALGARNLTMVTLQPPD